MAYNKEYNKAYYEQHKEKFKEYRRKYYLKNRRLMIAKAIEARARRKQRLIFDAEIFI